MKKNISEKEVAKLYIKAVKRSIVEIFNKTEKDANKLVKFLRDKNMRFYLLHTEIYYIAYELAMKTDRIPNDEISRINSLKAKEIQKQIFKEWEDKR